MYMKRQTEINISTQENPFITLVRLCVCGSLSVFRHDSGQRRTAWDLPFRPLAALLSLFPFQGRLTMT